MFKFEPQQRVMIDDSDPAWFECHGMVGRFNGYNNGLVIFKTVNDDPVGKIITLFVPPSMVVPL